MAVLGIETSCDETAAAIVLRPPEGPGRILSNHVLSQLAEHRAFGGVVPEIAARAHIAHLDQLIARALEDAGCAWHDLHGVAATAGPGLLGGLLVGLTTAKAIALARNLPLLAVNHLEGHALTPGLTDGLRPPYLLLLISGGHTQLLAANGVGRYDRYGTTIDDALGEAFDKVAKLLGLGYPGGAQVEELARQGRGDRFRFPRPLMGRSDCHFSFSGLKTAVRQAVADLPRLSYADKCDLCASFQSAIAEVLFDRTARAMDRFITSTPASSPRVLVVAGGVAANQRIRDGLGDLCRRRGFELNIPPPALCTDNAAIIAWAGAERLALGISDDLDFPARARWPLDAAAERAPGAGIKA
ncbi:MAG TPA: tRNA (adenosine(37)-N6)-threonylcarbamoyltransferase complex transferase subunit TsaD [Aestuariivirgaceae bacterium]